MDELVALRRYQTYNANGEVYAKCLTFKQHQIVNNESKWRVPEGSCSTTVVLPEGYCDPQPSNLPPTFPQPTTSTQSENSFSDDLPPLVRIWNENCGKLPKVKTVSKSRVRLIALRLRDFPEKEEWKSLAVFLSNSDWHLGKNDSKWVATFDFFIQEKTMVKFSEKSLAGQGREKNRDNITIFRGLS